MATQALELQRINSENTLKANIAAQVRAEADAAVGMDAQQKIALFEKTMDTVMSLRTMWLDHMRKLKEQQSKKTITLAEEAANIAVVDAKLIAQHHWLDNYKYESDEIPQPVPAPATGFDGALQGMLSKLTGTLGDGPFAFIGKLIAQIFSFIFPMISAFKEMGKKTLDDSIKEGSLEDADAELTMKENELTNKLGALEEIKRQVDTGEIAEVKGLKESIEALELYKEELLKLKELDLEGDDGDEFVPFAETTESYKRNVLTSRLKMFNEISSAVAPALAAHEELVAATQLCAMKEARHAELLLAQGGMKGTVESETLQARMDALQADVNDLKAKCQVAKAQEDQFLASMTDAKTHIEALFKDDQPLFKAEKARQKARITQETEAAERAAERHEKEMALMDAQAEEARARARAGADAA